MKLADVRVVMGSEWVAAADMVAMAAGALPTLHACTGRAKAAATQQLKAAYIHMIHTLALYASMCTSSQQQRAPTITAWPGQPHHHSLQALVAQVTICS